MPILETRVSYLMYQKVQEMKRKYGFMTIADLLRAALMRYAHDQEDDGVDIDPTVLTNDELIRLFFEIFAEIRRRQLVSRLKNSLPPKTHAFRWMRRILYACRDVVEAAKREGLLR